MKLMTLSRLGVSCLIAVLPGSSFAWSDAIYRLVLRKAIDTLPKAQKKYFESHRYEMPSLIPDEDPPIRPEGRRFALDALGAYPFLNIPQDEAVLMAKADPALIGRLPFLLLEAQARLVEAFKSGDKERILVEADAVAILAADLNNPLALSENFDGQKTGQPGLSKRLAGLLPESMEGRLKLNPEAARLLENPRDYIFGTMVRNHVWVDNLLYADSLAHRGKSGYGGPYFEAFELRAGRLLSEILSNAAADVGSFWYTAWTEAGRPELR
ncbi:MAG: hypothetical protein JJE39_12740 [Vicinamibacteria bacterium]|nr:hypothetical protein [Vicinamibacteria bacterium]